MEPDAIVDVDVDAGDKDMMHVCTEAESAYQPAYRLYGSGQGPQCAGSNSFCFFCAFSESPDGSEKGLVSDLKDLVRQLSREKKEIEVIATAVYNAYEEMVRSDVEWTNDKGTVEVAP